MSGTRCARAWSVPVPDEQSHLAALQRGLGWILVYAILIALLLGLIARIGRPRIWYQLGLAVAGVLQIVFALAGEDHPKVGILHPLNAFVILGLAGFLTRTAWRGMPSRT